MLQIKSTKDIKPESLMCLIYAPSSFGKTSLARTLPPGSLVISCENGLLSLKDFEVDYIELTPENRISHLREIISYLLSNPVKYKTIFVDGLGELSEAFLKEAEKKFPDKTQSLPRFGEYNKTFKAFLKALRDLKMNVFMTALLKEKNENGYLCNYPDLTGKIAVEIGALCDFVFSIQLDNSEKSKVKRDLVTAPIGGFICKDRSGKLDILEPMDLAKVINKIFN